MKHYFKILFIAVFLTSSCSKEKIVNENSPITETLVKNLTVFIVNDVHAQIDNFSKVKYIIDKERETTNVIVTSSGDIFSGNPIVDNYPQKGFPIIDLMNKVGFDIAIIGNHEYDYGETNLKDRILQADFDWVCANVDMSNSVIPQSAPFKTISIDDIKVTFLGLVETNGKDNAIIPSTHPWRVKNLVFERPENVVDKYLDIKEQEGSDLYIALTHIGYNGGNGNLGDSQLAWKFPIFDLILGGHSHSIKDEVVNGIPIFQSGSNLNYLGKITLTIADKSIQTINYELINLNAQTAYDADLKQLIDSYNDAPFFSEVIGYSEIAHQRSQVGNFTADAIQQKLGVDISFQNTGGVRTDLNEGNITKKEIFEILPFNNPTIIYSMSVKDIKDFLIGANAGFYYAGVTFENSNNGIVVKDLSGNIILDDTILSVGLNDYIPAIYDDYFPISGMVQSSTDAETVILFLEEINSRVNYPTNDNYFRYQ